jgi:molybdopterin synthase catalytic subunit
MNTKMVSTAIRDLPINVEQMRASLSSPSIGAMVVFCGDVRDHDHGRTVLSMDYETHPTAEQILKDIGLEIASEFSVAAIAIEHRYGALQIGDTALAVVVACAHRENAFQACQTAVDRVKEKLPMWKHQYFADGTDEWVNSA